MSFVYIFIFCGINNVTERFREIMTFIARGTCKLPTDTNCGKMKNLLLPKSFSVKLTLVIYLVNASLSRNFCQKSVRVNFCNFHTVIQCLTSSQPILLKKNLFSKGFTWPKLFQPLWYLKN